MHAQRLRSFTLVAALLLAGGLLGVPAQAGRSRIQDLWVQLKKLTGQIKEQRQDIAETRAKERRVVDQLNDSQEKLDAAEADLAASQKRVDAAEAAVREATARLAAAKARLKRQQDRFGTRVAAAYVQGPVGYVDVLFGANDLNDFLDRQFFVETMMDQDAEVLTELRAAQEAVERERAALVARERALEAAHREIEARKRALDARRREQQQLLGKIKSQRHLQEQELEELEADSNRIAGVLAAEERRRRALRGQRGYRPLPPWTGSWRRPASGPITSGFGMRVHPITGRSRMHNGIDIGAGYGSPVYAAAAGEVFSAGWNGGYGKCIIVLHGGGVSTLYGHCSSLVVRPGQNVRRGQLIGYVGSTGASTGPHLHFEVRRNGRPVNPR